MRPGRAERCGAFGGAGRPDSAVTTGTAAIAFAGRRDASPEVAIASAIPMANAHHGRCAASTTWPVSCCSVGAYANQAARPPAAPASAAVAPTTRPFATMTRRRLRSVAPIALSMPRARSRRWASTEKLATDSRPMNARPSTSTRRMGTAGERPPVRPLGNVTVAAGTPGSVPPGPAAWAAAGPSSMVTWLGCVIWPGATSANWSARLLGFAAMPVTRQVTRPAGCQVPPTCAPYWAATPLVSATWPGPAG